MSMDPALAGLPPAIIKLALFRHLMLRVQPQPASPVFIDWDPFTDEDLLAHQLFILSLDVELGITASGNQTAFPLVSVALDSSDFATGAVALQTRLPLPTNTGAAGILGTGRLSLVPEGGLLLPTTSVFTVRPSRGTSSVGTITGWTVNAVLRALLIPRAAAAGLAPLLHSSVTYRT